MSLNLPLPDIEDYFTTNQKWLVDDYRMQGVITRVYSGQPFLSQAINDMLAPFYHAPSNEQADIEFYLTATDERDFPTLPEQAELFCDMDFLSYSQHGDYRYLEIPLGAFAVADAIKGRAYASVSGKLEKNIWTIGHLIFFPLWAQMLKSKGLFPIHAAAAEKDGQGILFPAFRGSGKSVLSVNLAKAGYKLLGDDTVFLYMDNDGVRMIAFPEKINLRKEALSLFPEIETSGHISYGERRSKLRFDIEAMYPGCFVSSATPSVLIFPKITDNKETGYSKMSKSDALSKLSLCSLFFIDNLASREHFHMLSSLVKQTECFKLDTGTDTVGLLKALENILVRKP